MAPATKDGEVRELTQEEFEELLSERIRREFGMSTEEFASALERGDLGDEPGVMELAILLGAR